MFRQAKTNFKPKTFIAIFLTPILLLGFFVGPARAEWADHLVISAIQITEGEGKTNHDFIEVYNPTASDINLKGYRLVKRTKTGASDASIKSWTDDAIIKAHGWRLWASSEDKQFPVGIGADDSTVATIAADNGIAIRLGAADTGEIVDSAAWGAAENIFKEGTAASALGASGSLARKPGTASAGNGEDTNNNAGDFIVMANFIPRNSQSLAAPAIENSQASVPNPSLSPSPSPTPASSASSPQSILPVAEAGADKEAVIGENIDFDGSDSFDPQGKELIFNWDFGDKTGAKGINASHSYNAIGEYSVILKADNGENISEDSLKVKIVNPEFSDKIILSEIFPNPVGADKDGEWIELFNFGDKKVNLRGWILRSAAKTSGKQYVFSGDNFIEAKSFLVIHRSESGLVLTNESGGVSLAWLPDKILSEVSYGAAKEGKSYAYINNSWQWVDTPTPGKENSTKALVAVSSEKGNSVLPLDIVENMNGEEFYYDESEMTGDDLIMQSLATNAIFQSIKKTSIEDYLNKLISEKVDSAILKAKANEAAPQEEISSFADSAEGVGIMDTNKESACEDFYLESEKNTSGDQKDVRNNPWFYGNIALSALSLFLVWRYQEVRKKIKN